MSHPFSQVDVFTDELTLGNPLAVVHDAGDLAEEQLAAIAAWTNLSETTFLLPPSDPAADYRVRIFTAQRELPFAGHPTLGSAYAWRAAGGVPRTPGGIVQECGAGLVPVREDGPRLAFAAPPLLRSGPVSPADRAELIAWLGVGEDDVLDLQWADNGPGWVAVLLRDADTVLALRPQGVSRLADVGVAGLHPEGGPAQLEVRAFFAGTEDPVTGSLNAALAQWLIGAGRLPARYVAAQGTAIGRRGRVHVEAVGDQVWVGGSVVAGVTGRIAV